MTAAIEIAGLSFSYPDGRIALNDINLTVGEGEKVALVGPNGAGKSTLLLHLNGILRGRGGLNVMGIDVAAADRRDLSRVRALVGLVFQDPDDQLFSPTVRDDVAFGPIYMGLPAEDIEGRVEEAMSAVGLNGFGDRMPHHLSGGERKRAAIATVLSMRPQILAADEPTSGLDARSRRSVVDILGSLEQTVIVATHDLGMVRDVMPRAVVMDEGTVVADGPTCQILGDRSLLERHGLEA